MDYEEVSSNYIYVLDYEYSYNNNIKTVYLHALDTHYMVACNICYEEYADLVKSRKIHIKNMNRDGIICKVSKGNLVILFKNTDGTYLVADYLCNLSMMTLEEIKQNKIKFPDIKFVGKGITTKSGKIPNINERAIDIFKINSFNNKAAILGISTLSYRFDYNDNLVINGIQYETDRLEIPNFITKIDSWAFKDSNMKHAKIGNGVKLIGSRTFECCNQLEDVELGDSVEIIEKRAFFRCHKLTSVKFGNNIRVIQDEAFFGTAIKQIKFGSRLNSIGNEAFSRTPLDIIDIKDTSITKLTGGFEDTHPSKVLLPRKLEYINISKMFNIDKIKQLYIPESLRTIDYEQKPAGNEKEMRLYAYLSKKIYYRSISSITVDELKNFVNNT